MIKFFKKYKVVIKNAIILFVLSLFARFLSFKSWWTWFVVISILDSLALLTNIFVVKQIVSISPKLAEKYKLSEVSSIPTPKMVRNFCIDIFSVMLPQIIFHFVK